MQINSRIQTGLQDAVLRDIVKMVEAGKVRPPASVTATASKGPQQSKTPSVSTAAKEAQERVTGSGSKAGTASEGTRKSKGSNDVTPKTPAKGSDGAVKRPTAEERG